MFFELTPEQQRLRAQFAAFAERQVAPCADEHDRAGRLPDDLILRLGARGYLTPWLPKKFGGPACEWVTYGVLTQEIGRACASTRMLVTVQGMVASAIMRWGASVGIKERLLPLLAAGKLQAAFALSEPDAGSDAENVQTMAHARGDHYVLTGEKTWVSFGEVADLILVCARCDGKATAFLVERQASGLTIEPIPGLFGVRAARLATLRLQKCDIPKENILGKPGFGFSHVAATALDHGRFGVAWGCIGLMRACLEASVSHTAKRRQFGTALKNQPLVQRKITNMLARLQAAELLCYRAARLRDQGQPAALIQTQLAKYYAAVAAVDIANDTMQLHGGAGYCLDHRVQRYLRDAKLMEIIEGTSQIQQLTIGPSAYSGCI